MTDRVKRLKKLLAVQEQLKSLHETRRAGHLASASAAARDAAEIASRMEGDSSLVSLFPDIYSRAIDNARSRERESNELAARELQEVAKASARTNLVGRNYREAQRQDERERSDRERLEAIAIARAKGG